MSEVLDATCGFHLENPRPTCVESVVPVVAGIAEDGCEVTGGRVVANFISAVNDSSEGFGMLTQLACKRVGECYVDAQKAIKYCHQNPGDEGCMNYMTCECLTDLLSVIENLSSQFLRINEAIIEKIKVAGTTCRCEDVNYRALSLELSPSCALPEKIVRDRDIFSGDNPVITDTCNGTPDRNCVEDVVDTVDDFVDYGCEQITDANEDFIDALKENSEDIEKATGFACQNSECYSAIRTCGYYYQYDITCIKALSYQCKQDFLSTMESLSDESKRKFLKFDTSTINDIKAEIQQIQEEIQMNLALDKCEALNAKVASLQNETYCTLHNSILKGGHMFAGETTDIQYTCLNQFACVEEVTEAVRQITAQGCEVKQSTDENAKFLYNLNNNTEWHKLTSFICNSDQDTSIVQNGGCYNEMKTVVEVCKDPAIENCAESARSDCLENFIDMVSDLSNDGKKYLLGIDDATLKRIESWKFWWLWTVEEPPESNRTQAQLSGGASPGTCMAAIILCIASIGYLFI
eukprot:CAMPEP_0183706582 /NCGR_PEP_ID=MMETSP0737-20130205/3350_1 /TAXON_ID=385413 /ORGANISM="Thalassiosira miniscula, Strain CCMP1093" /LENGTH=520 /DNA_ID=CAMNT_0025934013 /DNA_START=250 /DNA_END=1812 /DNA_ORIENTATION=+